MLYFQLQCKAMVEVKLSAKNQIVIPREARHALGLKAGDKLLAVVREDRLIVMQKPPRYSSAIRGLVKPPYPEGYVQKERRSWE
jgi:AbrB family looped-hinge helix DNA binding protein